MENVVHRLPFYTNVMEAKKLNTRQVNELEKLYDRIAKVAKKYDEEEGTDIPLGIYGNGTVGSNLNCALASLETILQEY